MKNKHNIKFNKKELEKIEKLTNKHKIIYYSYNNYLYYKNNLKESFIKKLKKEYKNIEYITILYLDNIESILYNNQITIFISLQDKKKKQILTIELLY